jgi:tetratricopeptide (TPR) repeat protein
VDTVAQIKPKSSTALYAGWIAGATQVGQHFQTNALNRVIILSDGFANVGETNADTIALDVSGLAQRGVSTTIQLNPEERFNYTQRATVFEKLKDYPRVMADYNKAIELNPKDASHYMLRGSAYFVLLKDRTKAVQDLTKAIELAEEGSFEKGNYYSNLAGLYMMPPVDQQKATANAQKAVELTTKYLAIAPKDGFAYSSRAYSYSIFKDYPNVIKDLTKAIELVPNLTEFYIIRGETYKFVKEYEKAIADFTKVIELELNNNEAIAILFDFRENPSIITQ